MSGKVFGIVSHVMVMAIVISVILLFVGIGVLVLIHVCIVGRAFGRGLNSGSLIERGTASARNNHNSTSMSQDDLEKLPVYEYNKAVEIGTSPVDCVVCLENFKLGDKCRLLPICKHSFHAECIDSWLLKTPICPICRTSAGSRKGITTVLGVEGLRSVAVRIELREEIIQSSLVESQVIRTNPSSPLHNSPSEDAV